MSYEDERRGYNRARANAASTIGVVQGLALADGLQHRFAVNQLVAQINTANAINQELHQRLQASEECVRFLDQGNNKLCAELLDLGATLQACIAAGEKSDAVIALQKTEIARLTAELKKAWFAIEGYRTNSPF